MMKTLMTFAVAVAILFGAGAAFAHDHFRVIGTLTKHQDSRIEVKNRDGKTTAIKLDKQTEVTQDKKKVETTELKVGRSVVVDAYGDSEDDLLALEIRIVPAIAPRGSK
jgi:hypothetical protein